MELIVDFPRSQPPSCPQPHRRRVSFHHRLTVSFIEDLPIEHKADLWFSAEDMDIFKRQAVSQMKMMRSDSAISGNVYDYAEMLNVQDTSTFMGLEKCLSEACFRKVLFHKEALLTAIRVEQRRQRGAGICDPEELARISLEWSEWSRRRARVIGLLHASSQDDIQH